MAENEVGEEDHVIEDYDDLCGGNLDQEIDTPQKAQDEPRKEAEESPEKGQKESPKGKKKSETKIQPGKPSKRAKKSVIAREQNS